MRPLQPLTFFDKALWRAISENPDPQRGPTLILEDDALPAARAGPLLAEVLADLPEDPRAVGALGVLFVKVSFCGDGSPRVVLETASVGAVRPRRSAKPIAKGFSS